MQASTTQQSTGRLAFTLLELMVVIVLIGIVSAMILPEMRGSYEEAVLRASAREVAEVCQLAYSRAVSMNQIHRVRLEAKSGAYKVEVGTRDRKGLMEFRALTGLRGYDGKIDDRISVRVRKLENGGEEEPNNSQEPYAPSTAPLVSDGTMLFYPDGTSEAAEVLLQDRQGFGLRLRVNPVTARVQVSELAKQ